eukprot:1154540-Pelagomonas_calceolata.AAC.5
MPTNVVLEFHVHQKSDEDWRTLDHCPVIRLGASCSGTESCLLWGTHAKKRKFQASDRPFCDLLFLLGKYLRSIEFLLSIGSRQGLSFGRRVALDLRSLQRLKTEKHNLNARQA